MVLLLRRGLDGSKLDVDMKDDAQLPEPPEVEPDEQQLDLDTYHPTLLPLSRPGTPAEPPERPSGGLDLDLDMDEVFFAAMLMAASTCSLSLYSTKAGSKTETAFL